MTNRRERLVNHDGFELGQARVSDVDELRRLHDGAEDDQHRAWLRIVVTVLKAFGSGDWRFVSTGPWTVKDRTGQVVGVVRMDDDGLSWLWFDPAVRRLGLARWATATLACLFFSARPGRQAMRAMPPYSPSGTGLLLSLGFQHGPERMALSRAEWKTRRVEWKKQLGVEWRGVVQAAVRS